MMNVFHRDVRILVDALDRILAQDRAGITPTRADIQDLADATRSVREGLTAVSVHELTPPVLDARLERLEPKPVRMLLVDTPAAARAVLESLAQLPQASGGGR